MDSKNAPKRPIRSRLAAGGLVVSLAMMPAPQGSAVLPPVELRPMAGPLEVRTPRRR